MSMRGQWSALAVTHRVIASIVRPGAFCIDATAGNGGDAAFLCSLAGPTGHVLALDIQPEAVANTQRLLEEQGYSQMSRVLLKSHAEIDSLAPSESVDCIVFNFGWLPGGDHSIFTRKETSLEAVGRSLGLLKSGGLLSLCLYYGRNNGYEERDALLDWAARLDPAKYNALCCTFPNRENDPPFPIFVVKE